MYALVDRALVGEDVDKGQAVAHTDGVIVGVVGGGDLDGTRAKVLVDVAVGNDGDLAVDKGVDDKLADEALVALVRGVDGRGWRRRAWWRP